MQTTEYVREKATITVEELNKLGKLLHKFSRVVDDDAASWDKPEQVIRTIEETIRYVGWQRDTP